MLAKFSSKSNLIKSNLFLYLFRFLILFLQFGLVEANQNENFTLDIYGTDKLSASIIKDKYHDKLSWASDLMLSNRVFDEMESYQKLLEIIRNDLNKDKQFAYIDLNNIKYPDDSKTHITIDVVELGDKKQRMDVFLPKPSGTVKDPNHLIKSWQTYEQVGLKDFYKLNGAMYQQCPAWHCIYGFEIPKLKKFLKIFQKAEQNKKALIDVLRNDKDERKRQSAAYLLAHIKSKNELITALLPSIYDSNSWVRNSVIRVLTLICLKDPKCNIPIEKIAPAINFPTVTDRNKALSVIMLMDIKDLGKMYLTKNYGTALINNLKLQQPNNHDPAFEILKKISGKEYGERDYKAWENWLKSQDVTA